MATGVCFRLQGHCAETRSHHSSWSRFSIPNPHSAPSLYNNLHQGMCPSRLSYDLIRQQLCRDGELSDQRQHGERGGVQKVSGKRKRQKHLGQSRGHDNTTKYGRKSGWKTPRTPASVTLRLHWFLWSWSDLQKSSWVCGCVECCCS